MAHWILPEAGAAALNTYGAVALNGTLASCGEVLRDDNV